MYCLRSLGHKSSCWHQSTGPCRASSSGDHEISVNRTKPCWANTHAHTHTADFRHSSHSQTCLKLSPIIHLLRTEATIRNLFTTPINVGWIVLFLRGGSEHAAWNGRFLWCSGRGSEYFQMFPTSWQAQKQQQPRRQRGAQSHLRCFRSAGDQRKEQL